MIFLATVSFFNVLPLGGLFVYTPLAAITHFLGHFGFSFKLSIYYTKGAHSITLRFMQSSTFWTFWIQFQIVNMLHQGGSFVYSPQGALGHCLGKKIIVNFQLQGDSFVYSPEGHGLGKLKFSMSNLKVAHLITHLSRGGIGSWFGYSNFHFEFLFTFKFLCVSTRGIICWYTIGCSYPLFGAFVKSIVDEKKSIRTS